MVPGASTEPAGSAATQQQVRVSPVPRDHFDEQPPITDPGQRVEHEAAMALLARAAGVRTPRVLAVGSLDNGVGILVQEAVSGVALDIVSGLTAKEFPYTQATSRALINSSRPLAMKRRIPHR